MMRRSLAALTVTATLTALGLPVAFALTTPASPAVATPATPTVAGSTATPVRRAAPSTPAPSAPVGKRRELSGIVRLLAADTLEHLQATLAGAGDNPAWTGSSTDQYKLVLQTTSKTYVLTGRTAPPNTRVRASGTVSGRTFHADTLEPSSSTEAVGSVPTTGTTKVLVMLANWSAPDGVTQASAQTQLFTDTNGWYRDASYTKLGQTGDVTPWLHIAGPTGGQCYADHDNIMNQAKTAAAAAGYTLANYTNFVMYFPNNSWQTGSDCNGFAGWAYVGAQGTWLNGYIDRRVSVHEQGHNYGLWHSHSYLCTNVVTGSCTWSDYGDDWDAMGASSYVGHFNASQKTVLGWMGGRTVDLSSGGTATLAPLSSDAVTTLAASVTVSSSRTYWLEYRQPTDFDGALPAGATDGVLVHVRDSSIASDDGANLLDMRPTDGLSPSSATLRSGTSWTSPEGLTFSVGSVTASGASVTVSSSDTTPPTVTARTPATGATNVATSSTVTATFSEQVDGVDTGSFTLENAATGAGVNATVTRNGTTNQWILDPTATLAADTTYTATLWGGPGAIRDPAGHVLISSQWNFTTGPPPTATTLAPAANSTGASTTGNVTATFSEAVNGVSASTFTLKNASTGAAISAAVTRNGTTNQWILDPTATLAADTKFTATLTGGTSAIRDVAGNPLTTTSWTFTTGPAPTVTTRTPAAGATGVSTTGNVTATFSEAVTGISAATFTLKNNTTGTQAAAAVTRNGTTNQWILDPTASLSADTTYTAKLIGANPTAIRDLAGNQLTTTSWTFTTGPAPTVTARTPAVNATGVSRTANLTATFSEAVSGVGTTTFQLKNASTGAVITSVVSRNGTTNQWILNPGATLAASTRFTVTLTGGTSAIRDAAGNPLATTSWSFTTRA